MQTGGMTTSSHSVFQHVFFTLTDLHSGSQQRFEFSPQLDLQKENRPASTCEQSTETAISVVGNISFMMKVPI